MPRLACPAVLFPALSQALLGKPAVAPFFDRLLREAMFAELVR